MTMQTIEATEVNVYERRAANSRVHYQYDFKVTMPDVQIYRERRKARGATSPSAARQIGVRRLHDVLRNGPSSRREAEKMPTVEEFAPLWLEYSKAQRHKPSTLHNKALLLRCHILPLIGKLRLNEVTEAALALVVKRRADLEPGSVNNLLKFIIALLRCAKEKHGKKIEIPKAPYLTNEERNGSISSGDTILDIYHITGANIDVVLYIDEYRYEPLQAPYGFTCVGEFLLSAP